MAVKIRLKAISFAEEVSFDPVHLEQSNSSIEALYFFTFSNVISTTSLLRMGSENA
jgi:hypothetical protein